MHIKVIVAMSMPSRGIGLENNIPWYIPEDLKRFSKLTKGNGNNAIIMGRKTWESLPIKPLPQRQNIILSKTLLDNNEIKLYDNELYYSNLQTAIDNCKIKNIDTVWIIGGEKIYDLAFKTLNINSIYVTSIIKDYNCDVFFPSIPKTFNQISLEFNTKNDFLVKYETYENKNNPPVYLENNDSEKKTCNKNAF